MAADARGSGRAPASAWFAALRPRTLTIALTPVVVGASLAYRDTGMLLADVLLATLAGALLIQAGTNLYNDAADQVSGADRSAHRLGPPRACAEGWLTASQVRRGAHTCFFLALLSGTYLVAHGGPPIALIGIASLLAAYAYSAGPWRISYSNLGEVFVLIFFGLFAVAGSYYLQAGSVSRDSLLAGAYVGAPASAVLVVNNHRDRAEDLRSGRRTLSIIAGEAGSKAIFASLIALPFLLLPALGEAPRFWWWLPLLTAPAAVLLVTRLCNQEIDAGLNRLLAGTAQLQLALGVSLAVAWLLPQAIR